MVVFVRTARTTLWDNTVTSANLSFTRIHSKSSQTLRHASVSFPVLPSVRMTQNRVVLILCVLNPMTSPSLNVHMIVKVLSNL